MADWSTAVPDWRDRIMAGQSLMPALPLHDAVAEKALRIFKRLRMPDHLQQLTYGELCDEWVFDLVRAIFGSYNPETKARAIQEFFVLIPKKNGKSAIAAAIILTAIIMNERPYAEAILIAPTQKIAGIAFKQARGMIDLDPALNELFHVQDHVKTITHRITKATIQILSADGSVVTGSKGSFILVDETHVLGHSAKADHVFAELRGGLASRPEGFFLQITTQSKMRPHGQFKKELDRARAVRDGLSDHKVLPILYELPHDLSQQGAWRDEETWKLVNPSLGRSVHLDWLRERFAVAEDEGADSLALFASQHLNVEIGVGLHSNRWVGADYWAGCRQAGLTLDSLLETSDVAVIGADGGGRDDLFGLAVIGRHRETRLWQMWGRAWCLDIVPRERRKSLAPILSDFEAAGELTITTNERRIVTEAVGICARVRDAGLLPEKMGIGIDVAKAAAFEDELEANGFELNEVVVPVPQTWQLQRGIGRLEGRLIDGRACHGGQKIMDWAVGNARSELRGNNIYITKEAAGVAKIDPLMALFNASWLMTYNPEPAGSSYLEHDGLLVL